MNIKDYVASIPGFPQEGIIFRDVTPILYEPKAMREVVDAFNTFVKEVNADIVLAPEARGFLFGVPVALETGVHFAPVRKPGKLPRETVCEDYDLEYGKDTLCIHTDAIQPGQRVVIIDDLLATGGTVEAIIKIAEKMKATVVGCAFVIELNELEGRKRFKDIPVCSLTHFEGE